MNVLDVAAKCVEQIVADLKDRRGLRQEWEEIDDEIRYEILASWKDIIKEEINKAVSAPGG